MHGISHLWVLRDQFYSLHRDYVVLVLSTYCIALGLQYMWFYKLSTGLYKILTRARAKRRPFDSNYSPCGEGSGEDGELVFEM